MMMTACSTPKAVKNAEKPALVLVAFGTSVDSARQVFDYIDQQARSVMPGTTCAGLLLHSLLSTS